MRPYRSNLEEHEALGADRLKTPVAGRLAVSALGVLIFSAVFSGLSIPFPVYFGLTAMIVVEILLFFRRQKKNQTAVQSQQGLEELQQQEFEQRYEQAKLSGQLDSWKKEE